MKKEAKKRTFKASLNENLKNKTFREAFEHYSENLRLGLKVRKLRKHAGLTQVELAKRLGVSQQVISRIESGDVENPTIGTLNRIASAAGAKMVVEFTY